MNDLTRYRAVRDSMRPGDVVAFGGRGFVSDAIKFLTHSAISHVGVVFERFEDETRRVIIAESTSLNKISGAPATRRAVCRSAWSLTRYRRKRSADCPSSISACC